MNVNKPISRRKALKVMGLGMLAACVPTLPSFGESPKENEKKTKRLIFYFSATGNSLYIARQLGGDEATLLSISQEIHNEHPDYEARISLLVHLSRPIISLQWALMEPIARYSQSSLMTLPRSTVFR